MPFRSESELALTDKPMCENIVGSGQVSAAWTLVIALFAALIIGPTLHSVFFDPSTVGVVVNTKKNPGSSVAEYPSNKKSLTICADPGCLMFSKQQVLGE